MSFVDGPSNGKSGEESRTFFPSSIRLVDLCIYSIPAVHHIRPHTQHELRCISTERHFLLMPFESFHFRAEDLNMAPLAPTKSASSTSPRAVTAKASKTTLSTISTAPKAVISKASKASLQKITTTTSTKARAAATNTTLKNRMRSIIAATSSYFVQVAICKYSFALCLAPLRDIFC